VADTNALQGVELKTHPGSYYNYTVTNLRLDAATELMAVVFMVPEDCNITGMACYAETLNGTSPTYMMNIQGCLDDYPKPDGTILGSGTAKAEFAPTSSGSREAHDLDTPLAVTGGTVLAGVLEYASGTINSSNRVRFTEKIGTVHYTQLPIHWQYGIGGGSWNGSVDAWPVLTVTTDLGYDIGGIFNIGPADTTLSDTGNRWTMRIEIPADENLELHVDGFRYYGSGPGGSYADKSYKVGMWNDSGTELASTTIDSDQGDLDFDYYSRNYYFDEPVTIVSGEVFYCGFEETGDDISLRYADVVHADGLRSWPGGSVFTLGTWSAYYSTWTEDQTSRPIIDLILSSVHGSGGGGSSIPGPSMGVIG
jgi:hypothetical protein